jgi:hypothetical protein
MYQLYYERDGEKAIAILDKNKELIKNESERLYYMKGNSKYTSKNILKQTINILAELRTNGYGDKPGADLFAPDSVASKAREVYDFFLEIKP